ncbi:ABC transporter ATP-binding protein [Paenibacillus humicola]|uniref:ABC transporter ATP-binding protein n=1 Tax=Paenibacillus humicola TaxID=3110540 RepID=UPI00237B1268|nr:ABC transporter ATP-binding protein [Paenibacillus humicola]
METALELRDVSHVYVHDRGATLAVEGLNLTVARGEFVSLVGPSGCGKTTVLSLMAGLLHPARGTVTAGGEPVGRPTARIGYMLQQDYLFPWRTIMDNVLLGPELAGTRNAASSARAESLLAELGLAGAGNRMPHELSGGMRQRAALARTLATDPEVLLLDEPFSALDLQIKLQLEDLVHETLRGRGKTAVLVTHDLGEAAAMSDRVVVLGRNPGHIRAVFDMPPALRNAVPTEARKLPEFHSTFERIWETLEEAETSKARSDER